MKRFETVRFSDKQKEAAEDVRLIAIELEKAINYVRRNGAKNVSQNYLELALQHLEVTIMFTNKGISRNDNFL